MEINVGNIDKIKKLNLNSTTLSIINNLLSSWLMDSSGYFHGYSGNINEQYDDIQIETGKTLRNDDFVIIKPRIKYPKGGYMAGNSDLRILCHEFGTYLDFQPINHIHYGEYSGTDYSEPNLEFSAYIPNAPISRWFNQENNDSVHHNMRFNIIRWFKEGVVIESCDKNGKCSLKFYNARKILEYIKECRTKTGYTSLGCYLSSYNISPDFSDSYNLDYERTFSESEDFILANNIEDLYDFGTSFYNNFVYPYMDDIKKLQDEYSKIGISFDKAKKTTSSLQY